MILRNVEKRIVLTGLAVAIMTLTACASKPMTNYDPGSDFSSPKSYIWIGKDPLKLGQTSQQVSPFVQEYLMSATQSALAANGYTLVSSADQADYAVAFTLGSRDQMNVESYPGYVGMGGVRGGFWGGGMGMGGGTFTTSYTEGQLSIDLFDEKTKKPAWHGTYSESISSSDQKKLQESITKAVDTILNAFPPAAD